jgi:hypothetical protein
LPIPLPNLGKSLWPATEAAPAPKREPRKQRRAIDVNAVITRALIAAGLMK